jgi:hypothetical protein
MWQAQSIRSGENVWTGIHVSQEAQVHPHEKMIETGFAATIEGVCRDHILYNKPVVDIHPA